MGLSPELVSLICASVCAAVSLSCSFPHFGRLQEVVRSFQRLGDGVTTLLGSEWFCPLVQPLPSWLLKNSLTLLVGSATLWLGCGLLNPQIWQGLSFDSKQEG